jgi:hypothetical protein
MCDDGESTDEEVTNIRSIQCLDERRHTLTLHRYILAGLRPSKGLGPL